MALKLSFPFPIFAPLHAPSGKSSSNVTHSRSPTEIRFSRWNNADTEKFNQRKRGEKEDEGETRSRRRSDAATTVSGEDAASSRRETFWSSGKRSVPGRKSNHFENPNFQKPNSISHPAFRRKRAAKRGDEPGDTMVSRKASVSVSESGVSYVVEGAPFEFKYSYTETPKVKPLKLREAQFPPFGPTTTPRPWTGQKPLPPSKKKAREFDSFKLPPPMMKGVKPVQAPGPFLHGSGPKYTRSREEIMGDPLTKEEIKQLVSSSVKSRRQLNMGRDGLTHNMLENVHALWKRRRICKIKCIGVCTVDMDNVCHQLEEKTGGKIIHQSGGVLYLFRGRNYNYKTRPRYPLMLWKPAAPVYPRLLKQVPEGLTLEEAAEMRKKGRKLIPICKLAKNGAYYDLVKNVREAFEECELIRINCQGLEPSDFKKIGAKLQDLVPCVLMSFEEQHILLWRGQNWKSSLPEPEVSLKEASTSSFDGVASISPPLEVEELFSLHIDANPKGSNASMSVMNLRDVGIEEVEDSISTEIGNTFESENVPDGTLCNKEQPKALTNGCVNMDSGGGDGEAVSNTVVSGDVPATALADAETISKRIGSSSYVLESSIAGPMNHDKVQDISEAAQDLNQSGKSSAAYTNGVLILWRQAVDGGSAIVLDDANLNADLVYEKAVAFSQVAPPGPVFKHLGLKKVKVQEGEKEEAGDSEMNQVREVSPKRQPDKTHKKSSKFQRKRDFDDQLLDVATQGSLRVDELAKLLA